MAQKAKKDQARHNAAALNRLHATSLAVNVVFLLFHFLIRRRSLLAYALLSTPAFVCEYVLEASGRPRYDAVTGALQSPGQDLAARGLTEYMFDVVWVTWASVAAVVLAGDWAWLLWAAIPAYAAYLGSSLLGMGRQSMAALQGGGQDAAPQGNRRTRRAA